MLTSTTKYYKGLSNDLSKAVSKQVEWPDDQILGVRLLNLYQLTSIIEEGMQKFDKTLGEIVDLSIKRGRKEINEAMPFMDDAVGKLIEMYGNS